MAALLCISKKVASIKCVPPAQLQPHFAQNDSKLLGLFVLYGLLEQVVPILSLLVARTRVLPLQPIDLPLLLYPLLLHKLHDQHILKLQLF